MRGAKAARRRTCAASSSRTLPSRFLHHSRAVERSPVTNSGPGAELGGGGFFAVSGE